MDVCYSSIVKQLIEKFQILDSQIVIHRYLKKNVPSNFLITGSPGIFFNPRPLQSWSIWSIPRINVFINIIITCINIYYYYYTLLHQYFVGTVDRNSKLNISIQLLQYYIISVITYLVFIQRFLRKTNKIVLNVN